MFLNRPAKLYKDVEDSSFMPDIQLWQFGTDSLMKEIDSLSKSN